jgi:hypothetical protein
MSIQKVRKFCKECNKFVFAERPGVNHILHLILTLLTFGIWLIVWIGVSVKIGGWKCPICGSKV